MSYSINERKEYNKQYYLDNKDRISKRIKKRYMKNPDKVKEEHKNWREENPEYIEKYRKEYIVNNKEKISEWHKLNYKNNKEQILKCHKQWKINNRNKIREQDRQYYENHRDKIVNYQRQWANLKYKTDIKHKLNNRMSCMIRKALRKNKNGWHWEDLIGYNLSILIRRLKQTLPKGYTWQDYMNGKLHIDHIIPKSVFNYTKPEHTDFKRCWELKNLRLLPAKENIIKSNKINRPFQPALQI